jgi:hypothetical protein
MIRSYAGIGSRKISNEEKDEISFIAGLLKEKYVVYSGNAHGADVAFQRGSDGNCVVYLPWKGFNCDIYSPNDMRECVVIDKKDTEAYETVKLYHPSKGNCSDITKKFMARNYRQIAGHGDEYPVVDFVVCCADDDGNAGVHGGTGQAIRIAKAMGIPFFNIRQKGWKRMLISYLEMI